MQFFYTRSKRLFNYFWSYPDDASTKGIKVADKIADAEDFYDLCALYGYDAEEHIVQTQDGYLLGLHRLPSKKSHYRDEDSELKPVVYVHHGLLMNSEVWVCLTEERRCLPFQLVDQGYDVWFGNNRGNKYSKKCTRCSPSSYEFWDFSIDQFAFHDIPDSIEYILSVTGQESLSYIGFSQGTAQALASLSVHPLLNSKINAFIGLAPAMAPDGLSNGFVDTLVKASPNVLFFAFGRGPILTAAAAWQVIFYRPLLIRVIDYLLDCLFSWRSKNISFYQKMAAYPHLYSFTSTKSVVHWFQIIRNKCFQMFDDDSYFDFNYRVSSSNRYYKPAKYPTRNIKCPIVLIYGGTDSLIDMEVMRRELPLERTIVIKIPHYEHLDFLWAGDVHETVFPHIFRALKNKASLHQYKELMLSPLPPPRGSLNTEEEPGDNDQQSQ